jgi:hypothetical protein
MTGTAPMQAVVPQRRSFWLRCFLGKACFAIAVWLAVSSLSWARVEVPGPLHLWRVHGFFVNPAGTPIENVEVTLVRDGTIAYKTRTDKAGRFAFNRVLGRYWLHIDKSNYSQLSREVIVGLETATLLRRNTLYVIAGPGACADDCSSVFTSKSEFERAIRRNTGHHD